VTIITSVEPEPDIEFPRSRNPWISTSPLLSQNLPGNRGRINLSTPLWSKLRQPTRFAYQRD